MLLGFVIILEIIVFSLILFLIFVRMYYLIASNFYKKSINKLNFSWVYYLVFLTFISCLQVFFQYKAGRGGDDYTITPIGNEFIIQSNPTGSKIYKGELILDELKNFNIISYGLSKEYLYGNFISLQGDTAKFLLNMRNYDVVQFYNEKEYYDYSQKNNLPIIKIQSLNNNYNNKYYWYLKPYFILIFLIITLILIILQRKEIEIFEK